MSDLFRRASEALHPRQRQGSADSTEAPDPPDARKPSEPELLKQKSESSQPESHVNEAFAGTANGMVSPCLSTCIYYILTKKVNQIMFPFRSNAAIGVGHITRRNPPKQKGGLAKNKKTMIGSLGRRDI